MTRRQVLPILIALPAALADDKAIDNPAAELERIQKEPKLEKRAERALDLAEYLMPEARKQYEAKGWPAAEPDLKLLVASVDLAYRSLEETGKNPRKSKNHKKAEIRTRKMVRDLRQFDDSLMVDDRPSMEPILRRIREIHEDLLNGVMGIKD